MVIIFALVLLVSNLVTGFLVFKGVQLGLRWQLQAQEKHPPTMENPVQIVAEQITQGKQEEEVKSLVSEWLNGADERR